MPPRIYVGRYDPKFPGVAIRARGLADVRSFQQFERLQHAPVSVLEQLSDDEVVSDLSRRTVLEHETRHFHDGLLMPFGGLTTRLRICACFNGFGAALRVKGASDSAQVLPVPLQQWLRMTEVERRSYLSELGDEFGEAPILPVISEGELLPNFGRYGAIELQPNQNLLLTSCQLALADYGLLEELWRSPHARREEIVAPTQDMWEASGMLCQVAAIELYAGEPLMQRFLGWLQHHGPSTYRRGLTLLGWVLEQLGWPPTLRNYMALATWAQMGAFASEKVESTPGSRLNSIIGAVQRGARWSWDAPFLELVSQWDDVVDSDSLVAMHAANDAFDRFCGWARPAMESVLPAAIFNGLATARRSMCDTFLAHPDRYIDPGEYVKSTQRYALPSIGIEYANESAETDWVNATPVDWAPVVGFDDALALTAMAQLSDAVFLPGVTSLLIDARMTIERRLGLKAIRIIR